MRLCGLSEGNEPAAFSLITTYFNIGHLSVTMILYIVTCNVHYFYIARHSEKQVSCKFVLTTFVDKL